MFYKIHTILGPKHIYVCTNIHKHVRGGILLLREYGQKYNNGHVESRKLIHLCFSENAVARFFFPRDLGLFVFPNDSSENSVLNLLFMPFHLNVNPLLFLMAYPSGLGVNTYLESGRPMWNPSSIIC